jgi:hypothetical protein
VGQLEQAAEVCRVKAHGWRNEANTLEPETEEWKQLVAKAEAGEELSRFLSTALQEAAPDTEGGSSE